jgi:DNA-binding FrmR family transcriptional regulator
MMQEYSTRPESPELKADLLARLRRVEGQVRGVQRMIEDGRECPEILQQLAAVRAAVHQASLTLARAYMASYLAAPGEGDCEVMLDRLIATLAKLE